MNYQPQLVSRTSSINSINSGSSCSLHIPKDDFLPSPLTGGGFSWQKKNPAFFLGSEKNIAVYPPPENERMSPNKEYFNRKLPTIAFQGYVSFRGSNVDVDETALKTKMLNLKMGAHFSDEISNLGNSHYFRFQP